MLKPPPDGTERCATFMERVWPGPTGDGAPRGGKTGLASGGAGAVAGAPTSPRAGLGAHSDGAVATRCGSARSDRDAAARGVSFSALVESDALAAARECSSASAVGLARRCERALEGLGGLDASTPPPA